MIESRNFLKEMLEIIKFNTKKNGNEALNWISNDKCENSRYPKINQMRSDSKENDNEFSRLLPYSKI